MARTEAQKVVDENINSILKNQKAKSEAEKKPAALITRNADDIGEAKSAMVFTKEQLLKSRQNVDNALANGARTKEAYDMAKGAVRSAYNTAAKMGIPKDELKFIIENAAKYDDDFKHGVTALEEMMGIEPTFAVEVEEGFDAQVH